MTDRAACLKAGSNSSGGAIRLVLAEGSDLFRDLIESILRRPSNDGSLIAVKVDYVVELVGTWM